MRSHFAYPHGRPPPVPTLEDLGDGLIRRHDDFVVGLPAQPLTSTPTAVPGISALGSYLYIKIVSFPGSLLEMQLTLSQGNCLP